MNGVQISRKATDFVYGTLRPLRDVIVVRPEPVKLSDTIVAAREGSFRGTVLAAGPGKYPKVYNRDRSKVWLSEHFRRTQVKVGDLVELGGQEHEKGYDFPRVLLNGEEVILATEDDVAAVHLSAEHGM